MQYSIERADVAAVPEPASIGFGTIGLGLIAVYGALRRKLNGMARSLRTSGLSNSWDAAFRMALQLPIMAVLLFAATADRSASAGLIEYFDHAAFAASVGGGITTIGFDDRPHGNDLPLGDAYLALGLTIVQRDGAPINLVSPGDNPFLTAIQFNSLNNAIASDAGVNAATNLSDNFDFIISQPTSAAGLFIGNIGGGTTEVQFLGIGGVVLAQEVFDDMHVGIIGSGYENRLFYGLVSDQLIERIRTVEPAFDFDGTIYDDVQFKAAAVPEPSTLTMWAIGGLSVFGAWRRRKQRR